MASSTLRIPSSNKKICAAVLNDTTVDLFALHREQTVEDEADKTLLLRSKAQEQDVAFSPKVQPLSRYVGLPDRVKATMVSGWELYAASASTLAKWNVKRTGRQVWESPKIPKAADWDEFEHEEDSDDEEPEDGVVGRFARLRGFHVDGTKKLLWTTADCALAALDIKTGRFVTPVQPVPPGLAERRSAAAAAKAAHVPVGYTAAPAQWASPPAWAASGAVHAPVLPGFEDSVDHFTLPQYTFATCISNGSSSLPGQKPPTAAIVASGGTGGIYAWGDTGQPLWHHLAPPPATKGKRETSHLHAAVALSYLPRGNLLIVTDDADVFALEADTGKRVQGWGFALKPVWGKNYVEHMSVNYSRDLLVLVGHSGRVLLVDAVGGRLLRHCTSSLFNAEISDFAVQHFELGTQREYMPTALGGATPEEGAKLASWAGEPKSKFVISTLLVQDMNTASLAAIDIVSDEDVQGSTAPLPGSNAASGAAAGEGHLAVEMDVSNPMRGGQEGVHPCDRITGKIQATVLWHASGRNAEYGSGGVCASAEGVLLVGKARGDVEAWNITASAAQSAAPEHAGPVRWSKGVTDYLHFKPPWSAGEHHNSAAEDVAKAALLRKLKAGKDKKDAAVELSDADADHTLLVQEAGVLVTSHSNGDLRAWHVADGSLKWAARADPAKDVADHIQYMTAFSTGAPDRMNAVAFFANIDEVATVVALELTSGDVLWRQPVFPKAYIECSLRGLFFVQKAASLVAAFEPYVADPDEADEWAVKLTAAQKAEAKKDFDLKPLVLVTLQPVPGQASFNVTQRRVLRRMGTQDDCMQADGTGLAVVVAEGSISKVDIASGRILWRTQLPGTSASVSSWHWLPSSGVVILQVGSKTEQEQLLCFSDGDGKHKHSADLHGAAAKHAAANGLVACIEPGRGVRLLAAGTLSPLHEHAFAFNGVPSTAAFVTGRSTSCLQTCNPGRKALLLAAGATGSADNAVPERLIVLGTSGEVFSLNLADFLGPLHLSSRLELGEHAAAKGIKKLKAEQGLRIQAYVAAVLKLVDFVQMASFAFQAAVPPSLEDSSNTLEDFQGLGLDFITYPVLLFMTVGVIAVFTAVFAVSEQVEGWAFLNPNNTKATLAWAGLKIFAQVMTSVALIPIMNTLASAVDCTDQDGTLVWDAHGDSVQCFEGTHLLYVVLAAVSFLLYIPNVLRLLRVGSNLDGVELQVLRPWDWSGDDRSERAVEHLLSEKRSVYSTVQAVIKVVAAVLLTLFGQRRRVLVSGLVVLLGCALVTVGVLRSPFHYALASHMRTALDVGIAWTFVSSFVAALVIGDGENAASSLTSEQDTLLSILPAGILLALPIAMLVQAYCCCGSCCGCPLPQYTPRASKSAVGPRSMPERSSSEVKSPLASTDGPKSSAGAAAGSVVVPSPLSKLPDAASTAQMPDMDASDFSALAVQQHDAESDADGDAASSAGSGSSKGSLGSLGLGL